MSTSSQVSGRNNHFELRQHFVHNQVSAGLIKLITIRTSNQITDIFTKPTVRPVFERHASTFLEGLPDDFLAKATGVKDPAILTVLLGPLTHTHTNNNNNDDDSGLHYSRYHIPYKYKTTNRSSSYSTPTISYYSYNIAIISLNHLSIKHITADCVLLCAHSHMVLASTPRIAWGYRLHA